MALSNPRRRILGETYLQPLKTTSVFPFKRTIKFGHESDIPFLPSTAGLFGSIYGQQPKLLGQIEREVSLTHEAHSNCTQESTQGLLIAQKETRRNHTKPTRSRAGTVCLVEVPHRSGMLGLPVCRVRSTPQCTCFGQIPTGGNNPFYFLVNTHTPSHGPAGGFAANSRARSAIVADGFTGGSP